MNILSFYFLAWVRTQKHNLQAFCWLLCWSTQELLEYICTYIHTVCKPWHFQVLDKVDFKKSMLEKLIWIWWVSLIYLILDQIFELQCINTLSSQALSFSARWWSLSRAWSTVHALSRHCIWACDFFPKHLCQSSMLPIEASRSLCKEDIKA